jgi:hypothetical protein
LLLLWIGLLIELLIPEPRKPSSLERKLESRSNSCSLKIRMSENY